MSESTSESMGLFEAMYTTRSLRRFRSQPIPEPVLHRLVEAATRAPNATNRQAWRFLVIRDPELRGRVGELYRAGFDEVFPPAQRTTEADPARRRLDRSARHLADHMGTEPPVLILVCLERAPGAPPLAPLAARTSGATAYPAVQNLLLAARAYGIGGCLTTLHLRREAQVKQVLGIPDNVDTYALVPIGYPTDHFGPIGRRRVEEVTYADRWGAPFAVSGGELTTEMPGPVDDTSAATGVGAAGPSTPPPASRGTAAEAGARAAAAATIEAGPTAGPGAHRRPGEEWRGKIGKLSPDELGEFLAGSPLCRLACLDDQGWPYVVPCWFEYADGGFFIVPRERSAWARHVARDSRVALSIDEQSLPQRRVAVRGRAEVVETPNVGGRWVEVARRMAQRYLGEHGPDYLVPTLGEPRWLLFVRPEHVQTWQGIGWARRYKHTSW